MRLILLPGLDGTGELFSEFIRYLPANIKLTIISYPEQELLGYELLVNYVRRRLPTNEDYIILAESFSGPVAFKLAQLASEHLLAIIFVASFLRNPDKRLMRLLKLLPLSILLRIPPPDFVVRKWLLGSDAENTLISGFKSILSRLPVKTIKFRLAEIDKLNLDNRQEQSNEEVSWNFPVFYIQPLQDRLVPGDNYRDFEKRYSKINLFTLHGPHFILQAKAQECAKYVSQQLKILSKAHDSESD